MLAILVYLSLVAACVVVGMTYGRWSVGSCCGCTCFSRSQVFEDEYNLDNWSTTGTVSLVEIGVGSVGAMRLAAGATAEWNETGPTEHAVSVALAETSQGTAAEFKVHVSHGNSDGYYAHVNGTSSLIDIYNHAGTKLNTFRATWTNASVVGANLRVSYDGTYCSAQNYEDPSTFPMAPACVAATGATGTRFRIEAVTQTDILSVQWAGTTLQPGCVRPILRCRPCDGGDTPSTTSTVAWSGCTSGSASPIPVASTPFLAGTPYQSTACKYVATGSPYAEFTLTQLGNGNVGITANIGTTYGGFLLKVDWVDIDTGVAWDECDTLGTVALGSPTTYTLDGGDCEGNGGITASVTIP